MKVAILEFETHAHLLFLWFDLLNNQGIDFHFFVSNSICQQIEKIPNSKKSIINTTTVKYSELEKKLSEYDVVIFNTLHRNFEKLESIIKNNKTLLLVHNANFYFHTKKPDWNYLFKIHNKKLIYYYLKLIFKERIYKTKNFVINANGYGFLSEKIAQNNKQEKKQNFVVPLLYNKEISFANDKSELHIIIPGNVSQLRRNYFLIFSILPLLQPKEKLNFVFLGRPENKRMLEKLEFLKTRLNSNIKIKYYTKRIPQNEFDIQINSAHYLLCPVLKESQFYLQKEIYGKTKISGNEADCIHYGKIGIFPEYYPIKNWTAYYYKDIKDLQSILENLTFEQYNLDNQNLLSQAPLYSKVNAVNQIKTIFNSLLNS